MRVNIVMKHIDIRAILKIIVLIDMDPWKITSMKTIIRPTLNSPPLNKIDLLFRVNIRSM